MKFSKQKIIVSSFILIFVFLLVFSIKCIKENTCLKDSKNTISRCYDFKKYYTDDFKQIEYNNNCGPTLAINILSYYSDVKNINLFYDKNLQECYDKICNDVKYTSNNSTNLNNVASGLKKIAKYRRIQYSSKKIFTKFMV